MKKKTLLDLQMYATTGQDSLNNQFKVVDEATSTFKGGNEAQAQAHAFMSKNITEAVYEEDALKDVFDTITHPKNSGKTHTLQKWEKYDANMNEYKEGAIITQDSPQGKTEMTVTLKGYAGYAKFTEEDEIFSLSNGNLERISSGQGSSIGEKKVSMKYRALQSTTNRWYSGATAGSSSTHDTLLQAVKPFNLDEFRNIRAFLTRNNVKPFKNGKYLVLISPEVEASLFTLKKSGSTENYTFVEILNQQKTDKIFEGSIGSWLNFEFVPTNAISQVYLSDNSTPATSSGVAVTGCVVLGRYANEKGAVEVKLETKGDIETVIKPIGSIGTDYLNTYGTCGWKFWVGYAIKHPEAVMMYYCAENVIETNYPNVNNLPMATEMTYTKAIKANSDGVSTTYGTAEAPKSKVNGKDKTEE